MRRFNKGLKYGYIFLYFILVLSGSLFNCTKGPVAGDKGNSSETTNGIVISATTDSL